LRKTALKAPLLFLDLWRAYGPKASRDVRKSSHSCTVRYEKWVERRPIRKKEMTEREKEGNCGKGTTAANRPIKKRKNNALMGSKRSVDMLYGKLLWTMFFPS